MEKVKITKEQAKAIDHALNYQNSIYKDAPDVLLNDVGNRIFGNSLKPLNDMSVAHLAKALYIGYEVEGFKVGDWVSCDISAEVTFTGMIESIGELGSHNTDILDGTGTKQAFVETALRYATPEEIETEKTRRKWAAIGRDVDEYEVGDIVTTGAGGITREVLRIATGGQLDLESANTFYRPNEVYMVCPVEQRLDVQYERN